MYDEKLVVGNGVLDLQSDKLIPYTHKEIHRIRIPWKYNKDSDYSKILKFIESIVKKDDITLLQEFLGFTLCKNYKFQKFLVFEGRGSNGKSVFLKLLRHFYTLENYTGFSISDFAGVKNDDFQYTELFDKLINIGGDTGISVFNDSSVIKRLTGDDVISAKRKFKSNIVFSNTSKFISSFNELPETFDITEGLWRRVLFIEFPYTFIPKNDYDSNPKYKNNKFYKKGNENILSNLLTEENMEGLLKWMVEGYQRLISQGGFSVTSTTEEVRKKWIHKSNSFEAFIDDECEFDDGWHSTEILKKHLKEQYIQYCEINNLRPQNDISIKKSLEMRKCKSKQKVKKGESKDTYYWAGVRIKEKSMYYLGE